MSILVIILIIAIYFLPTIIASEHNSGQVFIVNLFFGWTLLGWVIAFVMSLSTDPSIAIKKGLSNSVSTADELHKLMELKDLGAITEKEYKKMRKKLIK